MWEELPGTASREMSEVWGEDMSDIKLLDKDRKEIPLTAGQKIGLKVGMVSQSIFRAVFSNLIDEQDEAIFLEHLKEAERREKLASEAKYEAEIRSSIEKGRKRLGLIREVRQFFEAEMAEVKAEESRKIKVI